MRGAAQVLLPALLVALLPSAAASAVESESVARMRARRLAEQGRCAEAVQSFEAAGSYVADSPPLGLVAGRCHLRLEQWSEAAGILEAVYSAAPQLEGAALSLAIARYHIGDLTGAETALEAARDQSSDPAQIDLYNGLLLLERGEARKAALSLERARRADADAVEPVASFYAVLAWQTVGERARAEEALERVRAADPDGAWTARAQQALSLVVPQRRWWASAKAGIEYDTNVVLRGVGVTLPEDISGEEDWRGAWYLDGGMELLRTEKWSAGVLASYWGTAQAELKDFDSHYPTVSGWVDRLISDRTTARVRADYTYGWVDYEPFVSAFAGSASVYHRWESAGATELSIGGGQNDFFFPREDVPGAIGPGSCPPGLFFCGPPGLDEDAARNRDGEVLRVALQHDYGLPVGDTTLRAGYFFSRYWSEGTEWDHQAHRFRLGAVARLPYRFLLEADGEFAYAPFDHVSTYPNELPPGGGPYSLSGAKRRDRIWGAAASLERELFAYTSASVRYTYTRNNSNTNVYDYTRHVVGGYLTVRLP